MRVSRRLALGALLLALAMPLAAAPRVQVRKPRLLLVPESMVNQTAAQQYAQMKQQAAARRVLNSDAPSVARARAIAARLIPHASRFNDKAARWQWEVNVIDAPMVNALCMPGGKIMVFAGLIDKLKLSDDELAAVIGHEIAHAALEHGRARMSEAILKKVGVNLAAAYFGLSPAGTAALAQAAQLAVTLPYSRSHETDADLVGIELAARAGFDPRAAVSVWRKMSRLGGNQPQQLLSTHPAHATRIRDLEAALPKVLPLYLEARRMPPANEPGTPPARTR
ncbi:MAG TPA: M48 family metallopeptidase [Burkholderiaceae bacterium]|nr:M48 family metallopeptidase [Burkholderiaceae bacterium]